jgi:hypothetical protein
MMNVDENQEELLSDEQTPLTDIQPNEEEIIPYVIAEVYDWNTSLVSRVEIFDKIFFF